MSSVRSSRRPRGAHLFATLVALTGAGALSSIAASAHAQAPPAPAPPAAPSIEPPRLQTDAPVAYPASAIQQKHFVPTLVVLLLEIDAAGRITKATAEGAPGHGFAEEAEAAARRLVFTPARRDGVAVPSRIKYRYAFSPPSPVLVGRVAGVADDASLAEASITVVASDGSSRTTKSDRRGRFRFEDLPAGSVKITVDAVGRAATTTDETLAYAEETNLVLRLAEASVVVAGSAPDPSAGATEPAAQEVSVRGERPPREVVKRSLSRQEIGLIPGTNGDALRSVQSLPGVARPAPFSGQLIVRGSGSDDTPIYVDGTPVPIVYHFGGLSSVLPTEALDRIDFYPGNFGAAYGRGMGGAVNVALRDPKGDRLHGMAQVDLIDARFLAEGPIGKTGWSFLVAGRRSYVDAWLGPVLENTDANVSTLPRYYDYQLMAQRKVGERGSFRATFFGSDDAFAFSGGDIGTAVLGISFWRLQGVYTQPLSDQTELRIVGAAGRDRIGLGFGSLSVDTTSRPLSLRTEIAHRIVRGVRANVGIDLVYSPYDLGLRLLEGSSGLGPDQPEDKPGARTVASTASGRRLPSAVYTELEITPWHGGRFVPSVRVDNTSTTGRTDVAPRLNVRQEIIGGERRTTLKAAAGMYYQPPTTLQSDPTFGQKDLLSSRAAHLDIGAEHALSPALSLSVDGYYKQLDRLVIDNHRNAGRGRVLGAEAFLRYQGDARFFGWISYGLSRSERRDGASEAWAAFVNDQTHVLTVVGSYALGRGWRLGGRFRYVSGNPYTPTSQGAYDAIAGGYLGAEGAKSSARLPAFHQLDLRVDKTWRWAVTKLTAYLDVQNVYTYQAPEAVQYNFDFTRSTYARGLPILPSLGARLEY